MLPQIIAPLLLRRLDPKVGGHRGICCMQRQEMVICLMMVAMVGGAAAQDDCTGAHPRDRCTVCASSAWLGLRLALDAWPPTARCSSARYPLQQRVLQQRLSQRIVTGARASALTASI